MNAALSWISIGSTNSSFPLDPKPESALSPIGKKQISLEFAEYQVEDIQDRGDTYTTLDLSCNQSIGQSSSTLAVMICPNGQFVVRG